jgi:hypothetical protein
MKKVLILAYDFPPYVSVGALRPFSWFKYMPEYGYFPIVITRQWANKYGNKLDFVAPGESTVDIVESSEKGTIIRTPYKPNLANRLMLKYGDSKYTFLRRAISGFFVYSQYLFSVGPKTNLYHAAHNYLKNNKVDLIIASGEPFVLFKYASKLSKKYEIDWIADYRDAWTQNIDLNHSVLLKQWSRYFEKKTVKSAKIITTVSEHFKNQIGELFNNKSIRIVSNGFDFEEIQKTLNINQNNEFLTIGFAGTINQFDPISSFLANISEFVAQITDAKIRVNFYGINNPEIVINLIETRFSNLNSVVSIIPKMPNEKVLEELAKCNLLLLFNYYSIIGTKIYNYLALKRVILFCFSNDKDSIDLRKSIVKDKNEDFSTLFPQMEIIKEANAGIIVENSQSLKPKLLELYQEFLENGKILCNTGDVIQFSRKFQVKKLCEILDNLS